MLYDILFISWLYSPQVCCFYLLTGIMFLHILESIVLCWRSLQQILFLNRQRLKRELRCQTCLGVTRYCPHKEREMHVVALSLVLQNDIFM